MTTRIWWFLMISLILSLIEVQLSTKALDMILIAETKTISSPDLTQVEAIGWTDLSIAGNSETCSRLDWIEVYGFGVEK